MMQQPSHQLRPRCSVYIATSLDGYIATVDGSTDFLTAVEVAGEDYGYAEFESTVDAFVVGSHTYEGALEMSAWPYAKRVVVLTTATHRVSQHGEEFFSGDVRDLTLRLGGEGLRHLYIDGGVTIRSFLAADLVDNLTISIIPVLLGAGVPLFTEAKSPTRRLTLTSCQPYDSGLVQLRYAAGVTAA